MSKSEKRQKNKHAHTTEYMRIGFVQKYTKIVTFSLFQLYHLLCDSVFLILVVFSIHSEETRGKKAMQRDLK